MCIRMSRTIGCEPFGRQRVRSKLLSALMQLQRYLASVKLLIIDELGYAPLSPSGAELSFETCSQRYERGLTIVTVNCRWRTGPRCWVRSG